MLNLRTLDSLPANLAGKVVLVRTDYNVGVVNGQVDSNFRIKKSIPTIKELLARKARVVLISHLGRPEGEYVDEFSLMPVRFELGKLLDMHIKFAHIPSCKNSITFMEDGEVLMLENVRFHKGETSKDTAEREQFIADLASLGHYYINDAFASYRAHASTYDLALKYTEPVAGKLMVDEVQQLYKLREAPEKPYVAVIGGAKLDTKVEILKALIHKADKILIGGAMAYTFLASQDTGIGNSRVETEMLDTAKQILMDAKGAGCEILLPIDHIAGVEFDAKTEPVQVDTQHIPDGLIGLDIGERTLSNYLEVIKSARTIMWNGPMGVFEWEKFSRGTEAVGEYIALSASADAFKVAGGGDTVTAMEKLKINFKNFDHVSTGGGAMLDFLSGEEFKILEPLLIK
jgi:phosphoglycerate kinase